MPCLIEIYAHAPGAAELRACLGKHIAFWEQCARATRAHRKDAKPALTAEPFLWIIAAGSPELLLASLDMDAAPGWPAGVYFFGGDVLRVGLVVASELPRERSTLLVRLMAAGPLLARAIEDLSALPKDAHERAVADEILLRLQHAIRNKPHPTHEEQDFMVTMFSTWDDAREIGRSEGHLEARAGAVLVVLQARGVAVPAEARERILGEKDPDRLERWLKRAAVAASTSEVLDPPGGEPAPPRRAKKARSASRH